MGEYNQEVKKPEPIIEKIPEKLLNPILDATNEASKLRNRFFGLSLRLAQFQKDTQVTLEKLENTERGIQEKIRHSFDKMKLGKNRKDVQWRFDGKDSFIGTVRPEPKKV